MLLTVSKRFEFCASHRYYRDDWSAEENLNFFGRKSRGAYGHGHNYVVSFGFTGAIENRTGMLLNVGRIKERIMPLLESRYDHKYLNADSPPFDKILPTPENLSRQLLADSSTLFDDVEATPVFCHLAESTQCAATAYDGGRIERDLYLDFSAARRTYSPQLSVKENQEMFGLASSESGHGHHYRMRIVLSNDSELKNGMVTPDNESEPLLKELIELVDHRNLNRDVPELSDRPMTTEMLTAFFAERLGGQLPLVRLRLQENDRFFAEWHSPDQFIVGFLGKFTAAHRLHQSDLSDDDNYKLYGKCNNQSGHGHGYVVECSITGDIDQRSGTLCNLADADRKLASVLAQWDYRHLDLETEDFRNLPSTGENIVAVLWEKLEKVFKESLYRVRLWETANNRFTLRRSGHGELNNN